MTAPGKDEIRNLSHPDSTLRGDNSQKLPMPPEAYDELESGAARRTGSSGDFDDGIRQSAHGAHKNFDDPTIELGVGAALEFGERVGGAARFFVRAVAGDGIVGVGNGDDARAEGDAFARQRGRITRAIEKFVVMQDHFADAAERRERIEDFCAKRSEERRVGKECRSRWSTYQ